MSGNGARGRQLKKTHDVCVNEAKEDLWGLQLSGAGAREAMRDFQRIDRRNPSTTLNGALLDLYHKDLLGGGHLDS